VLIILKNVRVDIRINLHALAQPLAFPLLVDFDFAREQIDCLESLCHQMGIYCSIIENARRFFYNVIQPVDD
jgi:hypothetical protein